MNTPEMREQCARQLEQTASKVPNLSAFVGLDGFVDEILHVVDKRESATSFQRMNRIEQLASRLAGASGKSTNLELVSMTTKLGGNGPIMANALASFGLRVCYLGNLGYPTLHPQFQEFSNRAEVYSIAEPGVTDALEFTDGKIMIGKHKSLKEVNWTNIGARFGHDRFESKLKSSDLIAFVNWTMLPFMDEIWSAIQSDIFPRLNNGGPRKTMFFDLADPEKRTADDIRSALQLISKFEERFEVILGLNEKESHEIAEVLGFKQPAASADDLQNLAAQIREHLSLSSVVIHPVQYAVAASDGTADSVEGPFVESPMITTGAGDHFNSGFCLGRLLGMSNDLCLLTGVTTSGYYVRTAKSPTVQELAGMLRNWPGK
jgi:sugar/nucleoside kinase (ribokinase family)